jgi:hypothetical protein
MIPRKVRVDIPSLFIKHMVLDTIGMAVGTQVESQLSATVREGDF